MTAFLSSALHPVTRHASVLLLLGLASACTPGAATPVPSSPAPVADPYTACWNRPDAEACAAETEARLLAASAGRAGREGGSLVFRGAGRSRLALENDATEGGRYVRYRYAGFLEEIGQHLVQVGFYEGGGWLLVDAETTNQAQILGPPVLSPDRRRFVATSVDLEAGYDPNGVQVWSLARGFPRLEWGVDGGDAWGASDAVWIDPRTVELTRHVNTTGDPSQTRKVRTRLVLGADGFTLRPAR